MHYKVDISGRYHPKICEQQYFYIIRYTGKISQEEYDELSADNDEYSLNDVNPGVGRLSWTKNAFWVKGSETSFYVGNPLENINGRQPSRSGLGWMMFIT